MQPGDPSSINMGPSFQPIQNTGGVPGIDALSGTPAVRIATINLASDEAEVHTRFWVTFGKAGKLTPGQLLDEPKVSKMMERLSNEGIAESESVMLAKTEGDQATLIFVSRIPEGNFRDQAVWVAHVTETLGAWGNRCVGFYFPPHGLEMHRSSELLAQTIRTLVNENLCDHFYLLVGQHNYNHLLNLSLNLKAELDVGDLSVQINH